MLNGLSLFSGYGGIDYALREYVRPVMYCEIEKYPQGILLSRMDDGSIPFAPIWNDVTTLDGTKFKGLVDIIYGGFPCFTAGTLILTREGFKPIEDVSIGDEVLTHKGRWRRVNQKHRTEDRATRREWLMGLPLGWTRLSTWVIGYYIRTHKKRSRKKK